MHSLFPQTLLYSFTTNVGEAAAQTLQHLVCRDVHNRRLWIDHFFCDDDRRLWFKIEQDGESVDLGSIGITQTTEPFGLFRISGAVDTFFQPERGSDSTILFTFRRRSRTVFGSTGIAVELLLVVLLVCWALSQLLPICRFWCSVYQRHQW